MYTLTQSILTITQQSHRVGFKELAPGSRPGLWYSASPTWATNSLYMFSISTGKHFKSGLQQPKCTSLQSLHVVNSPACIYSPIQEKMQHTIFLDCPLYYSQRMTLRIVVTKYTQFILKVLLYGDNTDHDKKAEIVQAVHDFINDLF